MEGGEGFRDGRAYIERELLEGLQILAQHREARRNLPRIQRKLFPNILQRVFELRKPERSIEKGDEQASRRRFRPQLESFCLVYGSIFRWAFTITDAKTTLAQL